MPKLLVIRFSSIGDIVLTSPIIRCVKQQIPEAEIHFITKKNFAPIVAHNPHISKVYSIQKSIHEVAPLLQQEKYDFLIDLHHNIRSKQIIWTLHKPAKSFPKLNFKKWLLVKFKINKMPLQHIVERYFKPIEALSVKNDFKGLDFFIPSQDEVLLNTLPFDNTKGYIAFVIGAQHFTKRMPNHKIIELCHQISLPVVLIGGKEDSYNAAAIKKEAGKHVFNACGLFNLFQSASIVRQARLVISNDTGMMHIAAAYNKKIISVWGNTVPEFGMTPYMPKNEQNSYIAEVKGLYCRPCSKIGKNKCPEGHFRCMNEISIPEILAQITRFCS